MCHDTSLHNRMGKDSCQHPWNAQLLIIVQALRKGGMFNQNSAQGESANSERDRVWVITKAFAS